MKVFVTGAGGYVGSALVKELIEHGHTVLGLARSDSTAETIKALGAEVHRGDLSDLASLRAGTTASDGVIHCAYDHGALSTGDFEGAARKNIAAIETIGTALIGTNKPFIVTSGLLPLAGHGSTENDAGSTEGFGADRTIAEQITIDLASQGVRSSVIRLPPTVHGGDMLPISFIKMMTTAASKHGFSAYVDDGATRWPAVNVLDAAVLYRLVLESGVAGRRYHAVADTGNSIIDLATSISEHLKLPLKSISQDEAVPNFGFIGTLMAASYDIPVSSQLTHDWTGWAPTRPSLVEELKRGNVAYY